MINLVRKDKREITLFPVLFVLALFFSNVDAVSGQSEVPKIPEPMFFDLVRPLGAKKGQWEANSLFSTPLRQFEEPFDWEPETEYVIGRGFAIEPQVIFHNQHLKGGQFTVQQTFGTRWKHRFIHGALGRIEYFHPNLVSGEWAYLAGARLNKRWSVFSITGLRRTDFSGSGKFQALLNPSIFYSIGKKVNIGLETNLALGSGSTNQYQFVPQMHLQMDKTNELQFGVGLNYVDDSFSPLFIGRIVKLLN